MNSISSPTRTAAPVGAAGVRTETERYRGLFELSRFPLADHQELVFAPLSQAAQTLPATAVQLLQRCRTFAPIDEHARNLCRELNLGPDQAASLRQQLLDLAQRGFLVAHGDLLARCRRTDSSDAPARITSVGIPTRDRTEALHRCVSSYLANGQPYGRSAEFIVVDDSQSPEVRAANRDMLRELRTRQGAAIAYAGPEDKARFADLLIRRAGLPAAATHFGLLNAEGYPVATGASRNALLLHTVGEVSLQVDDDTVCRLAPAPEAGPGLALTSQHDPTEFWFLSRDELLPAGSHFADADLLALHERLLGHSPGACLEALETDAGLDLNQAGAGFFRRLEVPGARVLVTAAGWAGDSGMGAPAYLLSLQGSARARLLRSAATYRDALTRMRVVRAVSRTAISEGTFCMAINLGLDNRQLLPPFMPVQRNQDGIFAALLRACFGGAYFGFLPWVLFHQSPGPRRFVQTDLGQGVVRVHSGSILQALVQAFAPGPDPGANRKNLVALGRSLGEWSRAPRARFEELTRSLLWNHLSRFTSQLGEQLRQYGGQPAFWADDVRQVLAVLREALPRDDFGVPEDLARVFGVGEAVARLQCLVGQFGLLLCHWPDMVEASADLRRQGRRLAVPL